MTIDEIQNLIVFTIATAVVFGLCITVLASFFKRG